jgi:hypothetical protein
MGQAPNIDGVLVQWGDRLFYPGNRVVKIRPQPSLGDGGMHQRADAIRKRIESTVVKRAPQIMVKVTGGGRGMLAIAAHFRYISKNGRLGMENEQGEVLQGRSAVYGLSDEWRYGGSLIGDDGHWREAFNIMLSMPRGTDLLIVQRTASELAAAELVNHKYVMVLHDHQANPHVHLSVRWSAESICGKRLNPRKADLQRWRQTFAEKLRGYGVEAEATRQASRFQTRNSEHLWRLKAREVGRLRKARPEDKSSPRSPTPRAAALRAWLHIGQALAESSDAKDMKLAGSITLFLQESSLPVGLSRIQPDRTQSTRTRAVLDHEVRR